MYLEKANKNKFTIGKQLRKLKGLRQKDPSAKVIPLTPQLQAYKKDLSEKGLVVGPIEVGLFQTRNGLQYPGFIAKQTIISNTILLKVPVKCLLTTRDAYLSQIQKVFDQNPKFYSKTFSPDWQDRIILTYLLFEWQKGKKSQWYNLLANLPRDIDYVAFWPQPELKYLEDEWLVRSIKKQRKRVVAQQQQLIDIARKYPQYFDMKIFTPQNITWIHVHLVTRCFGKYFQYTTMVPFAQLFNHECVDVYYTFGYFPDNPHDTHQQVYKPKELTQEQEQEADTSEGSYNASDVSFDDEYFQDFDLEDKKSCSGNISSQYNSNHSYITTFINFNDQISLHFLQKSYSALEEAKTMEDQNKATQICVSNHNKNVRYFKLVKEFFYKIRSHRYTYGLKQKKHWREKQSKKKEMEVDPTIDYFSGSWPVDKFDQFVMTCGPKDQFQAGSQVYFCYGRLPNRLLLMRYGIALEHNKYNHLFIRINVEDIVKKSIPLQRGAQDISMKKYRRFKVKRTTFCLQLVTYFRAMLWKYQEDPETIFNVYYLDRELRCLILAKGILQEKLTEYSCTLQQNIHILQDKKVGYHQYFATVYRVEQQRILHEQIKMMEYACDLINIMEKGGYLEKRLREEEDKDKLRMQIMMEKYFKTFKIF